MSEPRRCSACGAEIPHDTPDGLCPRCLLQAGLANPSSPSATNQATAAHSPSASFSLPALETLAMLFPQLEILELLGQGGMGAVYKARQPSLDRVVALKILPPEIGADPAFAQRFRREANALAKLSHPNIVGVYDCGQAGDIFYFLMEYVDGVNLREAMRQGKLQPAEALKIVPQVCDALQFAHDEGVVHRDIKPENILLDKRGRVKIADFGLAKLLGVKSDITLTATRQVMGTPHYMAPEQIQGTRDVDHRADIYSLGVTFYEMLTGELPLGRFAPPSHKVQIDVRLDEVVLRTLEREPEQRYQHASDVKTEIEHIGSSAAPQAGPPPRNFSRREALEQTIADLLPEEKIAGIRIYREATGAGLAEAMSAVKAIAQKHGKDTPVPFSWEHFIWAVIWAVAVIAGGFWLASTQNNWSNRLMFHMGGFVAALFVIAMNITWQRRRSRWSLEDLEESEAEINPPAKPKKSEEERVQSIVKRTADGIWLGAALSLLTGLGLLVYLAIVRNDIPQTRLIEFSIFAAAHLVYGSFFTLTGILLRRKRGRLFSLIGLVAVGVCGPVVLSFNVFTLTQHWPILMPFAIGVPLALWTTALLFREDVRHAFDSDESAAKPNDHPSGWLAIAPWQRGLIKAVLALVMVGCAGIFLFFDSVTHYRGQRGELAYKHTEIGLFGPWLILDQPHFETNRNPIQVRWMTGSMAAGALALFCLVGLVVIRAVEKSNDPAALETARRAIRLPADGLLLAACVSIMAALYMGFEWYMESTPHPDHPNPDRANRQWTMLLAAAHFFSAAAQMTAAIQMRRLRWRSILLLACFLTLLLQFFFTVAVFLEAGNLKGWLMTPFGLTGPLTMWATVTLLREDVRAAFEEAGERAFGEQSGQTNAIAWRWWLLPRTGTLFVALAGAVFTGAPWQSVEIRTAFTQGAIIQWFLAKGYESTLGLSAGLLFLLVFFVTLAAFRLRKPAVPPGIVVAGLIITAAIGAYAYNPPFEDRAEVTAVIEKLRGHNPDLPSNGRSNVEFVREAVRSGMLSYWQRLIPALFLSLGMGLLVVVFASLDFLLVPRNGAGGESLSRGGEDPRRRLVAPGVGLLVAALVNAAASVIALGEHLETWRFTAFGWESPWVFWLVQAGLVWCIFMQLVISIGMIRVHNEPPPVFYLIATMLFPPGMVLALPLGLWTLVLLGSADVKQAYAIGSGEAGAARLGSVEQR